MRCCLRHGKEGPRGLFEGKIVKKKNQNPFYCVKFLLFVNLYGYGYDSRISEALLILPQKVNCRQFPQFRTKMINLQLL